MSSSQISPVIVSDHKVVLLQMVSPQNSDTRGRPPPSAMPLSYGQQLHCKVLNGGMLLQP